jgi:ATP-dependent helicase/nuclease subunit B
VDEKNGVYRIIDYKTGKDKKTFAEVAALFNTADINRNKAVLQTLIYAHVLQQQLPPDTPVVAGLYDVRNMGKATEIFNWQLIIDGYTSLTPEISRGIVAETIEQLTRVLEEIFDAAVPFDQTTRLEHCQFCAYKVLCGR